MQPLGGFNDTNKQINKCFRYAWLTGRDLIIDTRFSGLMDHFSNYFELSKPKWSNRLLRKPNIRLRLNCDLTSELLQKSVFPNIAKQKMFTHYKIRYDIKTKKWRDGSDAITFNFKKLYSENCLVHLSCGGGGIPKLFIYNSVTFNNDIRNHIKDRLKKLGNDYQAIHVRNTDLLSDYKSYFTCIENKITSDMLLLCSDDNRVLEYGCRYFKNKKIIAEPQPVKVSNAALHINQTDNYNLSPPFSRNRYLLNRKLFSDLICLAQAKDIFSPTLIDSRTLSSNSSGFTRLVKKLHTHKDIVSRLMNG